MRKILLVVVAVLLIVSIGLACGPSGNGGNGPGPGPLCVIIRDDYGVPHVFANTTEGLGFGAGYAMAQDRLWQADVLRRAASGRLAEFNLATIDDDADTRTLWYGQEELLEMYENWNPGVGYEHLKTMNEAYIDGINTYIAEALVGASPLPAEYTMLGLASYLEPFTAADVVALTVLMGWRFGGTGGEEEQIYEALLELQSMHGDNGTAIWEDIFPLDDSGAPVTIPGEESLGAFSTDMTLPELPDNLGGLFEQYREFWAAQDKLFESLGIPTKFGSNAILISPELSATGNTLLLGGPQMGYQIPQIVYELGLHGAGINAVGMAIPAAGPFILVGVGEYGAWTSTTGASDVMDTRILTLNPENAEQYWYDGGWVDMEVRTETIYGPKKQTSQDVTCYRSVYGPIVTIDDEVTDTAITLHTPFFKNEIAGEQGWQLFQEATNIDEFETAVKLVEPNHNFYWADTEGNIGFWHAGRFPVKPGGSDRRLPLAGNYTEEWDRVTTAEEIPTCINPAQGWLANWNNKPVAGWEYVESDIGWGEGHHVQRLMDVLASYGVGEVTVADMNTINQIGGYNHIDGMNFVDYLIDAAEGTGNATVAAARVELVDWAEFTSLPHSYVDLESPHWHESNPTYDHAGLTIFDAWYDKIIPEVFDGILPSSMMDLLGRFPSLVIRVFEGAVLNYDYLGVRDRDELIVNALEGAIDALTIQYGSGNMSTWLTPVRVQNYDETGILSGDELHPKQNRGTYNQIAEMLTTGLPQGKNVIPPGQSGLATLDGMTPVPSDYAYDQLRLYAHWEYKPMLLTRAAVEAVKTWERVFE